MEHLEEIVGMCFIISVPTFIFHELINFFSILHNVGVTTSGGIKYAIKYKDRSLFGLVDSKDALERWPSQVVAFLKSNIEYQMPVAGPNTVPMVEICPIHVDGIPNAILGKLLSI